MADEEKTIQEEAGLDPERWAPIDVPPVTPGSTAEGGSTDGNSKYLQGSVPPWSQHDSTFVGTAYRSSSAPQLSIMPLAPSGSPAVNAAAQTVSTIVASQQKAAAVTTDIESIGSNQQSGSSYIVQSGDNDTLISLEDNSGGTLILPPFSPSTGNPTLVQQVVAFSSAFSNSPWHTTLASAPGTGNFLLAIAVYETQNSATIKDTAGLLWTRLQQDQGALGSSRPNSAYNVWFAYAAGTTTTNLVLTQVVGATQTYSYSSFTGPKLIPGQKVVITGFSNAQNNGTFIISTFSGGTSGTFVVITGTQVDESAAATATAQICVTVDTTAGASSGALCFAEFSGVSGIVDQNSVLLHQTVPALSTTPSVTTQFSNEYGLGIFFNETGITTGTNGWTKIIGQDNNAIFVFSQALTNVGSYAATANSSVSATFGYYAGILTFRPTSDASASLRKGFFTFVQNIGTGTYTVRSAAQIDNSLSPISLGPGAGMLFVFDGTSWFTERGAGSGGGGGYSIVEQAGVAVPQESILNFLAPITAVDNPGNSSTDIAVPNFVGDSGAGGVKGLVPAPAAGDAAANKFLKADGTFQTIPSDTDFYQTVQQAGSDKPQEPKLNFTSPITATDNAGVATNIAVPVFVASGASHATGLVPDPGSSAGTLNFLREDATFANPFIGRTTTIFTSASVASGAVDAGSFAIGKTCYFIFMSLDFDARVRLYSTAAARDADVARPFSTPVTAGTESEVIFDIQLTTSSGIVIVPNPTGLTWVLSPAVIGSNGDGSPSTSIYYNITNNSTGTRAINVTLKYLVLET